MFDTADFSVKPTLIGSKVILRPFVSDDLDAIVAALRDPDVRRLTGTVHDETAETTPQDPAERRRLSDWYATRATQTDRLDLAIVDLATGHCVGEAVLNKWDPGNAACNFRILIGPAGHVSPRADPTKAALGEVDNYYRAPRATAEAPRVGCTGVVIAGLGLYRSRRPNHRRRPGSRHRCHPTRGHRASRCPR
ncbi:GNAT family N-acetyltransferase [Nocardia sp. NPDC004340]